MKAFILFGIAVLLLSCVLARPALGQVAKPPFSDKEGRCDFSKYRRLIQPHTLYEVAVKKVNPEYPATARSVRASGKVVVRILVNKKGDVVEACVVEGHPLLRAASVKAAKQWKFKKNFGSLHYKLKQRFAETDLTFNFQP
ncbi:MAG: energy transducer TonB [Pyrinomonadaceae bacterium]